LSTFDEQPESADKDPYLAHAAAMHGDILQLTRLAKIDEKLLHYKDENGWRPFHEACRTGHQNVIDYLIHHYADINELTKMGDSPLRLAINHLSANHSVVAYLRSIGAKDISALPSEDPYVAHKAAIVGDITQLARLAEEDADLIHKKDENGWRPLHEAVRTGQKHVIEFLVERGADVNELTHKGESPLHLGRIFLDADHPVLSYLESLGAEDLEPEL
jgi:ankyrin repeat protein